MMFTILLSYYLGSVSMSLWNGYHRNPDVRRSNTRTYLITVVVVSLVYPIAGPAIVLMLLATSVAAGIYNYATRGYDYWAIVFDTALRKAVK